jgi:hypothetical protein
MSTSRRRLEEVSSPYLSLEDVFDHLNEHVADNSPINLTAELEKHLESKKKEKERLR